MAFSKFRSLGKQGQDHVGVVKGSATDIDFLQDIGWFQDSDTFRFATESHSVVANIAQTPVSLQGETRESSKTDSDFPDGDAQPDTGVSDVIVSDQQFGRQWHLNTKYGINVQSVWTEYNGHNVRIGIVDDGVQYTHNDLNNNYRTDLDYDARDKDLDARPGTADDNHGTAVAGVIAAEMNNDGNYGAVGVAWDADIVGFRQVLDSSAAWTPQILVNMLRQKSMDISSNSWSYKTFFEDNFETPAFSAIGSAIQDAAANGRGGLGTIFVRSAGNQRADGQDVNYHDFGNSPYAIAVAATDINGNIASFSTPGAAVLIAAPGTHIITTDRTGADGYNSTDFVSVDGTSFSAPIISGVVALMLEANPNLGYRDVQEILAYSAAKPPGFMATDLTNHATNWNGGGLTYNNDYGFGLVDAHAAVRLAESWTQQSTFANQKTYTEAAAPHLAIKEGSQILGVKGTPGPVTSSIITVSASDLPTDIAIDRVEVHLDISHTWIGDLVVSLSGPTGTTSTLINRPGLSSTRPYGISQDDIVFTTDTVAFWGETARGDWKLSIKDMQHPGESGTLNSWSIKFLGDSLSTPPGVKGIGGGVHNTYIYTDSYATYLVENANRGTLSDINGTDTINVSAITGDVMVDLHSGATSSIAGAPLKIAGGTSIENAYMGDGNDTVYGNDLANVISGGRGADHLWGNGGNDTFKFSRLTDAGDIIHDFANGDKLSIHDLLIDVGVTEANVSLQPINKDGIGGSNDTAVLLDPDGAGAQSAVTIATVLNYHLTMNHDIIV